MTDWCNFVCVLNASHLRSFSFTFLLLPIIHLGIMACKLHTGKSKCGTFARKAFVYLFVCIEHSRSHTVHKDFWKIWKYKFDEMSDIIRLGNLRKFFCLEAYFRYSGFIFNNSTSKKNSRRNAFNFFFFCLVLAVVIRLRFDVPENISMHIFNTD